MTLSPTGSSLRLDKHRAKWIGYVFLALWVALVFSTYLKMNRAVVEYCLGVYAMLLDHPQALMLLLIPSLTAAVLAATICLVKWVVSKRN